MVCEGRLMGGTMKCKESLSPEEKWGGDWFKKRTYTNNFLGLVKLENTFLFPSLPK